MRVPNSDIIVTPKGEPLPPYRRDETARPGSPQRPLIELNSVPSSLEQTVEQWREDRIARANGRSL